MSYRNWEVLITEHRQKTVHVQAENAIEAVAAVKKCYANGDYILDSDHFTGVEISTVEDEKIIALKRDKNGAEHSEVKSIYKFGGVTERKFVEAYEWMFGCTVMKAKEAYRAVIERGNFSYIQELIKRYEENSGRSFEDD